MVLLFLGTATGNSQDNFVLWMIEEAIILSGGNIINKNSTKTNSGLISNAFTTLNPSTTDALIWEKSGNCMSVSRILKNCFFSCFKISLLLKN